MKVALVHAAISGIGFNSYDKYLESSWISHGLCSIGAMARACGYDVVLIDLRTLRGWDDFRRRIENEAPDVVGLSMMSVDFNPAMQCIDIIKDTLKTAVTVIGGPHPTLLTDEVEKNPRIDYIIVGEGEISFLHLLNDLRDKRYPARLIKGITPELERLPFVDRDLFLYPEAPIPGLPEPFTTIIVGRGCQYNCSFCQPAERKIFGDAVRRRSVNNVIAELDKLRSRIGFKSLMIHDDCFLEDMDWVEQFCVEYKRNGFKQLFACQARADLITQNEDIIKHMRECGLHILFIGFESGSQRVLNFLRKGTTVEQNFQAADICKKYGIKIWANYMFGIPTETEGEVRATVRMIRKIRPDYYSPAFFTPLPGSALFTYCKEQNLSLIKDHDGYRRDPQAAKIKNVDYVFLKQQVRRSMQKSFWKDFFRCNPNYQ